jgi:hypothetical protein
MSEQQTVPPVLASGATPPQGQPCAPRPATAEAWKVTPLPGVCNPPRRIEGIVSNPDPGAPK